MIKIQLYTLEKLQRTPKIVLGYFSELLDARTLVLKAVDNLKLCYSRVKLTLKATKMFKLAHAKNRRKSLFRHYFES